MSKFKVGKMVRCVEKDENYTDGDLAFVSHVDTNTFRVANLVYKDQFSAPLQYDRWKMVEKPPSILTPAKIRELLEECEAEAFDIETRKRRLLAAQELVEAGFRVEMPDA